MIFLLVTTHLPTPSLPRREGEQKLMFPLSSEKRGVGGE